MTVKTNAAGKTSPAGKTGAAGKASATGTAADVGHVGEREIVLREGKLQRRTILAGGWTRAKQVAFLDHLAATCNIYASARSVGMTASGARMLRKRDAAFDADWKLAIEAGYELLEGELLARALGTRGAREGGARERGAREGGGDDGAEAPDIGAATGSDSGPDSGADSGSDSGPDSGADRRGEGDRAFDPELAFRLLGQRIAASRPGRQRGRATYKHVTIDEVETALMAKLDAMERRVLARSNGGPAAGCMTPMPGAPSQPVPSQPVPSQPVPSQPAPFQPVPFQPVPSLSVGADAAEDAE